MQVPSGQSTGANGTTFTLILPNPVQGGSYVCLLPSRHPSTSCLPPGSLLRLNDSLHVDEIRARLSLMEAEQNSLKNDNFLLKAENSRLSGLIQRVGSLELGQINTTDMVDQLMGQYSGLAHSLQAVQDMGNERGNGKTLPCNGNGDFLFLYNPLHCGTQAWSVRVSAIRSRN